MSQININPEEFLEIMISLILDGIKTDGDFTNSEVWNDFLNEIEKKGMKPILTKLYLKLDSKNRVKYKWIKPVFEGYPESTKIIINQDKHLKEEETFDRDTLKQVFRKVKEVRFNTSMPITENRLDKIIDHVLKERNGRKQDNG